MIKFRLRCANDHAFDSWFKDGATYERQEKRHLLECPVCGDSKIERAIMAPNVGRKGNARRPAAAPQPPATPDPAAAPSPPVPAAMPGPAMPPEMRKMLVEMRQQVEKNCDYVGDKFAEEARKIHYGEMPDRHIYGEATMQEARELIEEGVDVAPLPPDPEAAN